MTQQAPPFEAVTRRKILPLPALTKSGSAASSQQFVLPKTGLFARIFCAITGSVSGTLSNPNPLGFASIVSGIHVKINSGIELVNVSGAGYHYLLRPMLESEYIDPLPNSNATSAVTATNFDVSMVLPLAVNLRDSTGLLLAQNEQTTVTLQVDWAADSSVATGATVNATLVPYLEIYTVPPDPDSYPPLGRVQQILEEQTPITAQGNFTYNWPRGNVYLQLAHGLGIGPTVNADGFTAYQLRLNQSDFLQNTNQDYLSMEYGYQRGRARVKGGIFVDLLASNGLGTFGQARDLFNSALVTDCASVINVNATGVTAGTLYTVRRQLVTLA